MSTFSHRTHTLSMPQAALAPLGISEHHQETDPLQPSALPAKEMPQEESQPQTPVAISTKHLHHITVHSLSLLYIHCMFSAPGQRTNWAQRRLLSAVLTQKNMMHFQGCPGPLWCTLPSSSLFPAKGFPGVTYRHTILGIGIFLSLPCHTTMSLCRLGPSLEEVAEGQLH